MAIMLFTDFGANDLYVGQVKAVLDRYAPGVRVIDLLHEAPVFEPRASAHLLAALARQVPRGTVVLGVVDPGVGGTRDAVVLRADGRWYVGPDNGLFAVVAGRASTRTLWRLLAAPPGASVSFHGRDVFAPLAASVATDDFPNESVEPATRLQVALPHDDLAEVIYVDHYGNAFTGLRAADVSHAAKLEVGGRVVGHARVFADAPRDTPFWYENSLGLVELAVSGASVAERLGIGLGTPVAWASAGS
jgi:S-adenosylmethionine hydrolase